MKPSDIEANLNSISYKVYTKIHKPQSVVVDYVQQEEEIIATPNNSLELGLSCDPSGSLLYHYSRDVAS
jgi:hypothetical protein